MQLPINPATTKNLGGKEGGTVKAAMREFCSFKEAKNSTAAKKLRHRDLDHDGDKLVATADGCPAEACDKDGDGFQNASCNPPKSALDCNDNDYRSFPGAPDRCGDGLAQDCTADSACSKVTDKDGDRWSAPLDCNDGDANVHPWATEKCDRVDNDCDGLIDEGNPDKSGKLIPSIPFTCNDDNDGQCALDCTPGSKNCSATGQTLSGTCACSALKPSSKRDAGNRVACAGEDLASSASLRCFGAVQPAMEHCDDLDHDCDGKDFASGQSFAGLGKACSTGTGNCTVGKVTSCDPSKPVSNLLLVQAVDPLFQKYWQCSGTLPVPEVCDGRDDDCDGSIPTNEKDSDGDGYLACTGCKTSGSTGLAPKLKGCGDCMDDKKEVNPGASELCNGLDDNCKDSTKDDGKDECIPKGTVCCSTQKACKDTKLDKLNCGKCGSKCPGGTSDGCSASKCVCGTGPACGSGQVCQNGKCIAATCGPTNCTGCCDGNSCLASSSMTLSKCGKGGAACKSCSGNNTCLSYGCSSGGCSSTKKSDGTGCLSGAGVCITGVCCKGCVVGGACRLGTVTSQCGTGGGKCAVCSAGKCAVATCSAGKCGTTKAKDGTSCSKGQCYKGSCCKGCVGGGKCQAGTATTKCRIGGGPCKDCTSPYDCKVGSCTSSGVCKLTAKSNGTTCSGGKCRNGACCKGCWDGSKCQTGKDLTKCGGAGVSCTKCASTNPCKTVSCATGICATGNKANGASCTGGNCQGGICCTGCVSAGVCKTGNTASFCGLGGLICDSCGSGDWCKGGICLPIKL